jgi:tRNA nucleotidyltransferase/poly(A) polymerase
MILALMQVGPDSVKFTNIEGDVKRRTSLSMHFYDIEKGEIVDLVGGINDIKMVLLERLV